MLKELNLLKEKLSSYSFLLKEHPKGYFILGTVIEKNILDSVNLESLFIGGDKNKTYYVIKNDKDSHVEGLELYSGNNIDDAIAVAFDAYEKNKIELG